MASDLNKTILIGRLTRDPETSNTPSGSSVTKFSIANNKTWTKDGEKKEEVSFFNCTAWGKAGEIIAQYMKKGNQIQVDGRLKQQRWEDKDGNIRTGVEVNVEGFQFLGGKNDNSNDNGSQGASNSPEPFGDLPNF